VTIRADCRHYRVSRPCVPHKVRRARCDECPECDPIAERILVVKLGAMGDVLRSTSCLAPLKERFPQSHVTWVTRSNAIPLVTGNRWVDRALPIERNYLEFILSERFDLVLGLEAETLPAAIASLARAEVKRGFVADGRGGITPLNGAAREWWRMGLDDELKQRNRRTYGEWLYAICELPLPVAKPVFEPTPQAQARIAALLRARAPGAERWVCFNTGAGGRWTEKRWKTRHYSELAGMIRERDQRTAVVLVGGPAETDFNRALLASDPGFVDGGVENSVDDFAALIAACEWILTADSLGYHLACAVGTPAVCLVGPTSPWELDLYGRNRVLHSDLDCIACYRNICPLATTCMDLLRPTMIWPMVGRPIRPEDAAAVALPIANLPSQAIA
jgi:ADP-heptose:LPS heptosyltransferase